jgi:bacterial/archaeal transporter family-2 protein
MDEQHHERGEALDWLIVILVGLLGGIAVGVQSPIAGAMSVRVGGAASSFIVHLSGMLISGVLLLLRGGEQIRQWPTLSWYMLGSGVFGVVLYLTLSYTLPRVGATTAVLCIVVGQLLTGVVIDALGLFGVDPRPPEVGRLIGLVVVGVGAYLIVR